MAASVGDVLIILSVATMAIIVGWAWLHWQYSYGARLAVEGWFQ